MKVLQDIWIQTENGIVLFHRVFNEKVDEQLFGGLMAALNSFAEELVKTGLSNFELLNKRYTIIKRNNLLFIANSSKNVKEKRVLEELNFVVDKFFKLYPPETLYNWDNDINIFSDFENEIKNSLEETIKKFQDAFW
ncbi:MAG: hypothetical protein ACFFD5_11790 [Candidatus Thorarchaeota archaeon]